ncbi:MAG: fibronectin type III domain-containing protein, partial [Isosphaeraceae bacterium]
MIRNFSQKKINRLLCLLGLILFQSNVLAHEGPHKHPEGEIHKPTPVPDRVTLCVTQDPATSMAVNWRTDLSVSQGLVEYTVSQAGPLFIRSPKRIDATNEVLKSDL